MQSSLVLHELRVELRIQDIRLRLPDLGSGVWSFELNGLVVDLARSSPEFRQ